jgi:TM2 domain-containing membrane protein YozV
MSQNTPPAGPSPYLEGAPPQATPYPDAYATQARYQGAPFGPTTGNKSFLTTWLLSLLLGGLGIDRFYLGKVGTGILKLVTFGGFGIWALIDLILVLTNKQTDRRGYKLAGYDQHKKIALIVTLALVALSIILKVTTGGGSTTAASSVAPAAAPSASAAAAITAAPAAPAPAAAATWTKVAELSGSADQTGQSFQLSGKETRLVYAFKGGKLINGQSAAIAAIYLMDDGKDKAKDGALPLKMLNKDESGETAVHKSAGKYYLDVTAGNFDSWTITVEEKR